jgi:hypothetical protein
MEVAVQTLLEQVTEMNVTWRLASDPPEASFK